MAVEQKHSLPRIFVVDEDSQLGRVFDSIGNDPILLDRGGVQYRVERRPSGLIHPKHPERLQEALRKSYGAMAGTFTEEFRRELREQGEQDSLGRPADR
jgi:hypothetical protein